MKFRILPEDTDYGQDFVVADYPNIDSAARDLRGLFPTRSAKECVSIVCIDREEQEVDDSTYGMFVLGTGERHIF